MDIELGNIRVDVWPLGVIVLIILACIIWYKNRNLSFIICFLVFGFYILSAFSKIFFPIHLVGTYADMMRQQPQLINVNFMPFYFGPYGFEESVLTTNALNVILTIPFGFGINFILHIREKNFIWIPLFLGIGIEVTQFIISLFLGYAYRVVDINDVLMNALGVYIGYGIFRIFAWLYLLATKHFKLEHGGLFTYIFDVANRNQN